MSRRPMPDAPGTVHCQGLPYSLSREKIRESVSGCAFVEQTPDGVLPCHLPAWARLRSGSAWLDTLARAGTGISIRLMSAARSLELELVFTRYAFADVLEPARIVVEADGARHVVDLADTDGEVLRDDTLRREPSVVTPTRLRFQLASTPEPRLIVVRLSQAAATQIVAVRADARLVPDRSPTRPLWLHHGSSISHGTNLPDPESPWPIRAAAALGVQVINASFSGNALLDPFVAEAMSRRRVDVATFEVGINVVNWDSHIARTFVPALHGFLDRFRAEWPCLPMAVISPLHCPVHEHHPGPIEIDDQGFARACAQPRPDALDLTAVRELIETVVAVRDDPLLDVVDGRSLLGPAEEDLLTDGLHPGEAGTALIAERFAGLVRDAASPLGHAFAEVLR